MSDKMYNYDKAGDFAPDYDMFLWSWGGDVDPTFILSVFLTDQIENWSDCAWSNAELRRSSSCSRRARSTRSSASRSSGRCRRSSTSESPYIPLSYPSSSRPTTPAAGPAGCSRPRARAASIYTADNIDSYLFVAAGDRDDVGAAAASNTGLIVGIVVAVVVVIGIVVWLAAPPARRRAGRGSLGKGGERRLGRAG